MPLWRPASYVRAHCTVMSADVRTLEKLVSATLLGACSFVWANDRPCQKVKSWVSLRLSFCDHCYTSYGKLVTMIGDLEKITLAPRFSKPFKNCSIQIANCLIWNSGLHNLRVRNQTPTYQARFPLQIIWIFRSWKGKINSTQSLGLAPPGQRLSAHACSWCAWPGQASPPSEAPSTTSRNRLQQQTCYLDFLREFMFFHLTPVWL